MMVGRTQAARITSNAADLAQLALRVAQDKELRERLLSAAEHGARAALRTRQSLGLAGAVTRLVADQAFLKELQQARRDLEQARRRIERKRRRHLLRNLLVVVSLASVAAVPQLRNRLIAAVKGALNRVRPSSASDRDVPTERRLEDMPRDELYSRAQDADVPGRSEMSKDQLVEALRNR
jgi:hypothetical protein